MESNVLNELIVVKRSGQRVPFNGTKIAIAIKKAFDSIYDEHNEASINKVYNIVLKYIMDNYSDRKTITVEAIQDIIEYILRQEKYEDVYSSFNTYRLKRKASREAFDRKQQHKFIKATEKLILTVQDEESNPLELLFRLGETISSEFAKSYLIDSKYVRSHEEGSIFIHDLDYYVLGATFSSHLDLSFINDYEYYFENLNKHLLCVKEEQCGEHSITSIDYLFVDWILYEFKTILKRNLYNYIELEGFTQYLNIQKINEIIDKMDNIYYKDNIFDKLIFNDKIKNIFLQAKNNSLEEVTKIFKKKLMNLLISLDIYDHKINPKLGYSISLGSNNSNMGMLINKIYLEAIEELPRLENVTTIVKVTNKNNEFLENISKLVILNRNIVFNYIHAGFNKKLLIDGQYKTEVEYFSDGKRILENVIDKNQTSVGRSIVSKVSINLVRLALESKNIKDFYSNLDNAIDFSRNELLQSFEYISSKYKKNYKYSFNDISIDGDKLEDDKKIRKVIRNGTLGVGYAGLKESLCIILNKEELSIDDIKIAVDIVKFMKEKCDKYTDEHKLNFTLFETIDKDILDYFETIDRVLYGDQIKFNYTPFYLIFNDLKLDYVERFKIESKLQKYSNGGYYEVINIPKNYSYKKISELVESIKNCELGYVKIKVGKLE